MKKKFNLLEKIVASGVVSAASIVAGVDAAQAQQVGLYMKEISEKNHHIRVYTAQVDPDMVPSDFPINAEIIGERQVSEMEINIPGRPNDMGTTIQVDGNKEMQYIWVTALNKIKTEESGRSNVVPLSNTVVIPDYAPPITRYIEKDINGDYIFETNEAFCIDGDKTKFFVPDAGRVTIPQEYFVDGEYQFSKLDISDAQENTTQLSYFPWTVTGQFDNLTSDGDMVNLSLGTGLEGYLEAEFPTKFTALPSDISSASLEAHLMGIPVVSDSNLDGAIVIISDGTSELEYNLPVIEAGGDLPIIDLAHDVAFGDLASFDWANADSLSVNFPVNVNDENIKVGEIFYTKNYGVLTKNLSPGQYVTTISESDYSSQVSAKLPRRSRDSDPTSIVTGSTSIDSGLGGIAGTITLDSSEYGKLETGGVSVVLRQGVEHLVFNIPKSQLKAGVNFVKDSMWNLESITPDFDNDALSGSHEIEINAGLSSRSASDIGDYKLFSTAEIN